MNFFLFFFADYLLNRLYNIVANFDTFILNIKIVMINYLKSCVGCGTQYSYPHSNVLFNFSTSKTHYFVQNVSFVSDVNHYVDQSLAT